MSNHGQISLHSVLPVAEVLTADCHFQILRLCSRYDHVDDSFSFSNDLKLSSARLEVGGLGALTMTVCQLAQSLHQLDLDTTEYAILCAMCLLSGGKISRK